MDAVVNNLLHACRGEDRHLPVHHRMVGLVENGRGLASMIIPHRRNRAAPLGRPAVVRVAKSIARPVNARPFAVPKAVNPIEFRRWPQRRVLRAPNRRGAKVFVQRGLKQHIHRLKLLFGAMKDVIDPAKRRSAIARDIASGVLARLPVTPFLGQHQANQRLRAVQKNLFCP